MAHLPFGRRVRNAISQLALLFAATVLSSAGRAAVIVDMDFASTMGVNVPNIGIGPDGVLKGGASVAGGLLVTNGSNATEPTGAGLDLNLGAFGYAFSGANDFLVEFEFQSIGGDTGSLFSADGSKYLFDTIPGFNSDETAGGGQAGSINIYLDVDAVVVDLWYMGEVAVDGVFNDNALHTLSLSYNAADAELFLTVDGIESGPLVIEDGDGFLRDTTNDVSRLGDENNPDFGAEFNDGFNGRFDNFLVEGPTPPPVNLVVDRDTGTITLEVTAATPITTNSISLISEAGALNAANYDPIDASNPTFDADDAWVVNLLTDVEITESDDPSGANNGATLTNGQTFSLGAGLWRPFFDGDLEIALFDVGLGVEVLGTVEYVGDEILYGDLNLDGAITTADYVLFRDGFDEDVAGLRYFDAYFLGDLNGDEVHNFDDFIEFVSAYDAENGGGAFAAAFGVPEPNAWGMFLLAGVGLLMLRSTRGPRIVAWATVAAVVLATITASTCTAQSAELVEYLFTTNFNDTSGTNRHGIPVNGDIFNAPPTVSGGRLVLSGDVNESLEVPLGAANPFGGEDDYTISTKFTSSGSSFDPSLGLVLFSSADADEPTEGDNQSMSIYINSQADGGGLVVDYFFNSEVVVPDAGLLDGLEHSIIVTYVAPDDPGDPNDPNPGSLYINIDGDWIGTGDIAPRPPTITNHVVRIGTSLNTDFPFINTDDPDNPIQVNTDFEGTVDDFRILDEEMAPTLLRATVDVMSGEVTLLTGELHRELRYYEIVSAEGSLNPAAWASLSDQNLNPSGVGIGDTWDEFAGSAEQLAEGRLNGGSLFSPSSNTSVSLGNVFTPFGAQDLEINAVTTDNEPVAVEIVYSLPPSLPADFDNDGDVDGNDLAQWRGDFGINDESDADGDNDSDGNDFLIWQRTVGNTSPMTTAAGTAMNGVPEPNCIALLVVALLFAPEGTFRRRTDKR